MDNLTPWAICLGVFIIYPAITFVLGFYLGRRGLPFDIQITRKSERGRGPSMVDDEYGLAAETT